MKNHKPSRVYFWAVEHPAKDGAGAPGDWHQHNTWSDGEAIRLQLSAGGQRRVIGPAANAGELARMMKREVPQPGTVSVPPAGLADLGAV